jgi:AraC-like DNA-binding protein
MHEELIRTRVRLASELLAVSDRPLQADAEASGFNSLQHFHDTFRGHHRPPEPPHRVPRLCGPGGDPAAVRPARQRFRRDGRGKTYRRRALIAVVNSMPKRNQGSCLRVAHAGWCSRTWSTA